jgi:uncharacterized protein YndB with AHSA1/START domain
VASVDTGFVGATPGRVFEVVADPASYPRWWPGARGEGPSELRLPGIGRAGFHVGDVRPGVELTVRLEGRRHGGRLQWYLEPFEEGTVVYGIVDLETDRRWTARRKRGVRAGIRRAMVALKEMLE